MKRFERGAVCAALYLAFSCPAAAGGLLGIDHALTPTDAGIWARRYTLSLEYGVVAVDLGGAIWLGGETLIGKSFWQTTDAIIFGQLAAQAAKYAFGRERPSQTSDPNQWFRGLHAQSFPSGEVTLQASFVTPFIANYADRNPWVWALEALPAYDAAARVKEGAHWQSDVLAGWALGTGLGYYAAKRQSPFFLSVLPHGFMVGLHARF
ncbi:MAG TPA: phosphatase PAP2 family protein [Burkholderiaceae bacterium]|nr:phosphatase PAP2 family protein [Burkholderiaceae bacterium]